MMHFFDNMKRCPFCGNPTKQEMRTTTLNGLDGDNYEFSISCLGCGTSKRRNLKTFNTLTFDQVIDAMNATIADWNKRVNE